MGRLNKKLSKKLPSRSVATGLSSIAAKALLSSLKDTDTNIPTDVTVSTPAPTQSFSLLVENDNKLGKSCSDLKSSKSKSNSVGKICSDLKLSKRKSNAVVAKKVLKSVNKDGKIVKLKKKDKMKIRTGMLVKKLSAIEKEKKEIKDKQQREKVVIVKDTKPLKDNLDEIAEEIEKEDKQRKLKARLGSKKPSKHTLKMKKQKEQFMKDIEFLKSASKHPDYVKNPIDIVSTHIKNTVQ